MYKQPKFKEKQSSCSTRRIKLIDKATKSELIFKKKLKQLNIKFLFQKGFIQGDNFCIVDFYLPKPYRTCIEIDGGYHNTTKQQYRDKYRDKYRDIYLTKDRGFKIIRFTNEQATNISLEELERIICYLV
jgi:very-short-patch-repair endonuclease